MTDADVDGAHIRTLLLTFFYRYLPAVIESGFLYIAQPPLYRLQKGKDVRFVYTDAEKEKAITEIQSVAKVKGDDKKKAIKAETVETDVETEEVGVGENISGITIQRYKGLGEMSPQMLWDTTMNPANRVLMQVKVDDAEAANEIFDVLMGADVAPRKRFIHTHAKAVKNLDI
jgi:DNA gyrase subunit B